jgi:acyl-CoA thioesterase
MASSKDERPPAVNTFIGIDTEASTERRGGAATEATEAAGVGDHLSPVNAQRLAELAAETLGLPVQLAPPGARDALLSQNAQRLAERAAKALFSRDSAAKLLGIHFINVRPGFAALAMTVSGDMVNGHQTCHGGLIFTLADTAFAVSCNSHNERAVAASASIDFLAPAFEGDELSAEANEIWRSGRAGIYEVTITNQRGERIALFRGRSHRIGGAVTTE